MFVLILLDPKYYFRNIAYVFLFLPFFSPELEQQR